MKSMRFLLLTLCFSLVTASSQETTFYVSSTGNDRWSGSKAEPASDRTDGPFATLERARDAVRSLKQTRGLPEGGITIRLRGGNYQRSATFRLTAEDGGTSKAAILWRAYEGEKVHLSGGMNVSEWTLVRDVRTLQRLVPPARGEVLQVDLKALGITEFGTITQRGTPGLELFFNGERMTLARYPNTEWLRVADVPQSGEKLINQGLDREKRFNDVPVGRHYGRISYDDHRPNGWAQRDDIYLHGYWTWDWSDSFQKVKLIDTLQREIEFAEPHHHYGYTKNQRYYYLNILEELDTPGEWYLDRSTGMLYFWPPSPVERGTAVVSLLEEPLLSIENVSNLTIRDFAFEYSRGTGITLTGGSNVLIAGCTVRLIGGEAVTIEGGTGNGVMSSDIYDVGLAGIRLSGGDRKSLTAGNNFVFNNHIHHYSRWVRTGYYAVTIDGVANRVAHNLVHDSPFEGMYLKGNEHIIEFNEIHHVNLETGDAGAIHTGRDWTWRGNIIRHNYFHHLLSPGLHGVMAAYLDDWGSGFTIYGNVFYKAGRAAFMGGGRDNRVENNIFVDCAPSVHVDARGLSWAGNYFDGTFTWLFDKMDEMNFSKPPFSVKYPELLKLYDDEPRLPKNNVVTRNISYGGRWMDVYDYLAFDFSIVTVKDNLIASPNILRRRSKGETGWDPYYLNIDQQEGYDLLKFDDAESRILFKENVFMNGNPGFIDAENGNFQLRDDSPAFKLGFKRIPMEKIGLMKDEYRMDLPR